MGSRRRSRELALQMLFQWEMGSHTPQHVIRTFLPSKQLDPDAEQFACMLFEGTVQARESLDRSLSEYAQNWRLERMPAVDRNVLRLALYEMLNCTETPPAVVINEALEIVRRFSSEDSVEFVNGILDAIRKATPALNP